MRFLVLLTALAATQAAPQVIFVIPPDGNVANAAPLQAVSLDQEAAVASDAPVAESTGEAAVAEEVAPEATPDVAAPETADEAPVEAVEAAPEVPVEAAEAAETAPEAAPEAAEAAPETAPEAAEAAPEAAEEVAPKSEPASEAPSVPEAVPEAINAAAVVVEPAVVAAEVASVVAPVAAASLPTLGTPAVTTKLRTDPSTLNLVNPLEQVDVRFRQFIYPNDAPDVVAAKVALFRLHAQRHPTPAPTVAPAA